MEENNRTRLQNIGSRCSGLLKHLAVAEGNGCLQTTVKARWRFLAYLRLHFCKWSWRCWEIRGRLLSSSCKTIAEANDWPHMIVCSRTVTPNMQPSSWTTDLNLELTARPTQSSTHHHSVCLHSMNENDLRQARIRRRYVASPPRCPDQSARLLERRSASKYADLRRTASIKERGCVGAEPSGTVPARPV